MRGYSELMDYSADTGRNIRILRISKRWSIEELAYMMKSNKTKLSRLERGERLITVEEILQLCVIFNVSYTKILSQYYKPSIRLLKSPIP